MATATTDEPTFLTLTVTIKVTAGDCAMYAANYDLAPEKVTDDLAQNFRGAVRDALATSRNPVLASYSTHSVSAAS